jgi:hypothetical protein
MGLLPSLVSVGLLSGAWASGGGVGALPDSDMWWAKRSVRCWASESEENCMFCASVLEEDGGLEGLKTEGDPHWRVFS